MARLRLRYEALARRYAGRLVGWVVWQIPEISPRTPRTPTNSTPVAVADFYGQDAQGRATQYAKQLSGEK